MGSLSYEEENNISTILNLTIWTDINKNILKIKRKKDGY